MAVNVGKYKEIEVTVPKIPVTDEDVENQLQQLLLQYPVKLEKNGPVSDGDVTTIDFEGFKDGAAFEGGKGENFELGIGSHSFIPGFEEQMIGMKKGETRDLNLTFPENYQAEDLAGADVVFKVTVHQIFENKPAELNDEFVKAFELPDVETPDDLREYFRQALAEQAVQEAEASAQTAVMEVIVNNSDAEPSENDIEKAIDRQITKIRMNLLQQGVSLDSLLESQGGSMEELRKQVREVAEKQVRLDMALLRIAEIEGYECTDEMIEEQYQNMCIEHGMPISVLKERVPAEDLRKDFLHRRAASLVMKHAIIHYTE